MWFLIGLAWIAMIVGVIMFYRRKQRQRDAGRAEKLAALMADLKSGPVTADSRPAAPPAAASPAATRAEFRKKQRLLPQSTALIYYVFRTGLPDHEIFTGLTLADVLETDPATMASGKAGKLLAQRLDLVVCTRQLEVVAGVVIGGGEVIGAGADYVGECLRGAGIRILRIDPKAAPRHHQVRELVYGAGA